MLALRRLLPATRSLHSSAVAWKGKAAAADEDVDMDDLFDDSVADLPAAGGDRAARRADIVARIMNPSHGREEHRAGNLRKVVQLSDTPEQLEELGRVIQQWRVNGYAVSKQTSTEIVGRCINRGRADLAEKYYRNRADYGLKHIPGAAVLRLKAALAEAKEGGSASAEDAKAEASPASA